MSQRPRGSKQQAPPRVREAAAEAGRQLALVDDPDPSNVAPFPKRPAGKPTTSALALPMRSSQERAVAGIGAHSVEVFAGRLNQIDPLISRTYLPLLITLGITHPTMSQGRQLVRANANQGHAVAFQAAEGDEALVAMGEIALNEYARRCNPMGGGIESLINAGLDQAILTGALSAEDVIAADRRGVDHVSLVPVQDLEFYQPEGRWVPYQRASRGLIRLDPRTYTCLAWQTFENNPYPIPPFVAAINSILRERHMLEQQDAILEKVGWLGLLALKVPDPYKDNLEMDEDQRLRAFEEYLAQLLVNLGGNYRKGITALDKAMEFEFEAAPGQSLAGAAELLRLNEEQMFSGIGLDPALFGRNWAKTETWLGVARSLLEDKAEEFQRLVTLWLERSLGLEMTLRGIPLAPYVEFKPIPTMRPEQAALADEQRWQTMKDKVIAGLISPDAGAKEVGLDGWFNLHRLPANEGFDSQSQWAFVRELVREGAITPGQAAAMLGLSEWADPSKITNPSAPMGGGLAFRKTFRFRHDKQRGRYEFDRPMLTLTPETADRLKRAQVARGLVRVLETDAASGKAARLTTLRGRLAASNRTNYANPDAAFAKGPADPVLRRMVERFMARYAGRVAPILDELQSGVVSDLRAEIAAAPAGTWKDEPEFARWALDRMQESFGRRFRESASDPLLEKVLDQHEEMNAAWRSEDRSTWKGEPPDAVKAPSAAQDEAVLALTQGDTFHVSVYLESMSGEERKAVENVIADLLRGGKDMTNPDTRDEVLNELERSGSLLLRRRDHGREGGEASETDDEALDRLSDRMRRIVATSTMRSQTTAAVLGMEDAEIEEFEIVAEDNATRADSTEICSRMNGRRFKVQTAAGYLKRFHGMTAEEQEAELTRRRESSVEERIGDGVVSPPFHPWCACTAQVVL